jgi:hypothetical protein
MTQLWAGYRSALSHESQQAQNVQLFVAISYQVLGGLGVRHERPIDGGSCLSNANSRVKKNMIITTNSAQYS